MTKEELKEIWHTTWNKLSDQHFEAFMLNGRSEINPNDFIGSCLAQIYNLGVEDAVEAIKVSDFARVIDPNLDGTYPIPYVDREWGDETVDVYLNKEEILNLKIK